MHDSEVMFPAGNITGLAAQDSCARGVLMPDKMPMSVAIIIPARMASTRLPGKPLAEIAGLPMIVHVMRRAEESGLGQVIVACDGEEIAAAVRRHGGNAIVTDPDLPSGSDRIWAALENDSPLAGSRKNIVFSEGCHTNSQASHPLESEGAFDPPLAGDGLINDLIIINLQGDLPTFDSALLPPLVEALRTSGADIATLITPIVSADEHENPSVVKAVVALDDTGKTGRALYFTRATAPYGEGVRYHHIGVYAYRYGALKRFVALPPSALEIREKLEQLRALEAGMQIAVLVANTVPLGVDTPEDLARARAVLSGLRNEKLGHKVPSP